MNITPCGSRIKAEAFIYIHYQVVYLEAQHDIKWNKNKVLIQNSNMMMDILI